VQFNLIGRLFLKQKVPQDPRFPAKLEIGAIMKSSSMKTHDICPIIPENMRSLKKIGRFSVLIL
jgi:hypothetical protein